MADHTPVTASVALAASGVVQTYTAGAAIAAGDIVYYDSTNNNVKLAQCDGTAAEAAAIGVALNAAATGQPVQVALSGSEVTMGAAVYSAAGVSCFLSTSAGKTMNTLPAITNYVTYIGWSLGTTSLKLAIHASGIQSP